MARPPRLANFAGVLRYYGAVTMYFPAGIPLVALVALVIWKARQEAERTRASGNAKS